MTDIAQISDALVGARRAGRALPGFPGNLPDSLDVCYQVQARSRGLFPDKVAGWKVGGIPPQHQKTYGATRLTGPIWAGNVHHSGPGTVTEVGVFPDGFAAVESELVFRLGQTRAEDKLHIGIEIASSPIPDINGVGPAAVVCDFGNNNGLIVGPEIPGWRDIPLADIHVETIIDGERIGKATAADSPGGPQAALDFWLEHAATHNLDTSAGVYISSGAVTGVHDAVIGSLSRADFGALGSLDVRLVPAVPVV
ncbi:MAG: 2-keto-4-pentenoate hydratase [Pacificimonas sp.]